MKHRKPLKTIITLLPLFLFLSAFQTVHAVDNNLLCELEALREQVHALRLHERIGLTGEQQRLIRKQSSLAVPIWKAYHDELAALYVEQGELYAAYRAECAADEGFTPEVERRTSHLHIREIVLGERIVDRVNALAEPVLAVLSEPQIAILETFEPKIFPVYSNGLSEGGSGDWRSDRIGEVVREALELSDRVFQKEKDDLQKRIFNLLPPHMTRDVPATQKQASRKKKALRKNRHHESRDDLHGKIGRSLDELRAMPRDEVVFKIDYWVHKKFYRSEVAQLEEEMRTIRRSKRGELTPEARYLLNPVLWGDEEGARVWRRPIRLEPLDRVQEEINFYHLLNGLHLTDSQVRLLIKEAKKLQADLDSTQEPVQKKEINEEIQILRSVRGSLLQGARVPSARQARYRQLKQNEHAARYPWAFSTSVQKRIDASSIRVREAMSPAQCEILADYKPCLIPPGDLKNPVRVGQAGDRGPVMHYLDEVRALPERIYLRDMDAILEDAIDRAERQVGAMKPLDRASFMARVIQVTRRARNMSEVDYALNRQALAEELAPADQAEEIRVCLEEMGVPEYQLEGKIVHFLLLPGFLPLLEERYQRMKSLSRQ